MGGLQEFWSNSDLIGRAVAVTLLGLSIGTWVIILWKGWVLRRALNDIGRGVEAFWQAPSLAAGRERLAALDREQALTPLTEAAFTVPSVIVEVGRALAKLERRPSRTILFVSFTGEERDMLGSRLYTSRPVLPLSLTKAMINIDHAGVGNARLTVGVTGIEKILHSRRATLPA